MPSLSASDCVRLNLIVTGPIMHAIMPATMLALMQAFEDYQRGRFLMMHAIMPATMLAHAGL